MGCFMAYDKEINFVYKRRKMEKNCSSVLELSETSTPTLVYKRRKIHINPVTEENPKSKMQKSLEFCAVSDSCSSSKSSMDRGSASMKIQLDEPYKSNVRIGKDFQAEVPDMSYSFINDVNSYGEPAEISHGECGVRPVILSTLGSIGNWLQCRQVLNSDGTICGKWRRAPLFEVQTDNWECFCTVLWDPTHADSAVPQELDTDQVLKHLEFIEMLRPRLMLKRCKLGINKGVKSH